MRLGLQHYAGTSLLGAAVYFRGGCNVFERNTEIKRQDTLIVVGAFPFALSDEFCDVSIDP